MRVPQHLYMTPLCAPEPHTAPCPRTMNPEVNVTTELPPRTYVDYRTPDNFTNHSPKMKNEQATTNYDFAGDVRCRSALLCALSDEPLSCMHQVSRHFARSFLLRISERLRWLNMDVGAYVLALYIETTTNSGNGASLPYPARNRGVLARASDHNPTRHSRATWGQLADQRLSFNVE